MAKIFFNPDQWVHYTFLEDRDNIVDPASVEIKIVNHAETERYSRIISKDSEGKTIAGQNSVIQGVTAKQFEEHVRNPSNLFRMDPNGKPVEMKTASELYEFGDTATINETIRAMESNARLTEGQKKTLSLESDTVTQS